MRTLTDAQREAIADSGGRLRILACAGSETEVLAQRAVRLLMEGADPASIIAFTFTEKAAAELKARVESRAAEADQCFRELPLCGGGLFVGTTHGWTLQALQQLGGRYETLDGLTAEQEWVLLHRVARRLGVVDLYAALEGTSGKVAAAPAIDVFLRSVEVVHNERIDRAELARQAPAFAAVAELARRAAAGEPPTEADVDAILDRSFYLPFAGPIPAAKLREAARRRGGAYSRRFGEELVRATQPEVRFEVPLANARVRGRIDLLLRAPNGDSNAVELIDFKTSSNRPPSEVHQNQLRMYAVAVERLGFKPVSLVIQDLDADAGGRHIVLNDHSQREEFTRRLEGWVDEIRGGRFDAAEDRKTCAACDFRCFCAREWRTA